MRNSRRLCRTLYVVALASAGSLSAQSTRTPMQGSAQSATLEVAADSAGQRIRVNGVSVGVTGTSPVSVTVPAGAGVRVEVGEGRRARSVTFDIPASGRVRLDVIMPRDTQPVPVARSLAEIERELRMGSRYATLREPTRPVRPSAPTVTRSVLGGLAVGALGAGIGAVACEQKFSSPAPYGGFVGGKYYPPGSHSRLSAPCLAMTSGAGLLAGTVSVHSFRRVRFRRTLAAFSGEEARYNIELTRYRQAEFEQNASIESEAKRLQADEIARRRAVVAANEMTERANRELPLVTFINAPGARAQGARTTLVPPSLRIASMSFTDTDGDSVVGAGERASVTVRLRNEGRGPAYDVRLETKVAGAALRALPVNVGTLSPGEERDFRVDLSASPEIADGIASLEVGALEANGFDSDPFVLRVATLAFRAPELKVIDVGVEDPQGRSVITPNVAVRVTVRVQNRGGAADGVRVVFSRGDSTLLFVNDAGSSTVMQELGRLRAGETRDVSVDVMANRRATGFPLRASVIESTGRFGTLASDLGLQLMTPQRAVAQMDVIGRAAPLASATVAAPALGSSLLQNIPMAIRQNPNAFAVIIGNRNYRSAPSVEFAANDASVVRQYAERALGIKSGNILVLEDATLTDLKVTFGDQGNPNGKLRDMLAIPDSSEIFVFYSGHGAPDPTAERAYLMPVDADANRLALSGYSLDLLYENLAAIGARHVTVVLDACFSGGSNGGQLLIASASPIGIRVRDPAAKFAEGAATVIAAADGQQLANWYPEQRHGMLTYFFLKGLQGDADADRDGAVSVEEMRAWLSNPSQGLQYEARRVHGRAQTPRVFGRGERIIRR